MYKLLSVKSIIPSISFLTYGKLWKKYLNNEQFDQTNKDLELYIRKNFLYSPEYVYEKTYQKFLRQNNILILIEDIANTFLEYQNTKILVKNHKMEEWQGLISIISPIPFVAYFYHQNSLSTKNIYSILPTNNYISQTKDSLQELHDTHIHINGTSETFYAWNKALSNPKTFIDTYNDSPHHKNSLEELLLQDSSTSIYDFFIMLESAKKVRDLLEDYIKTGLTPNIDFYNFYKSINSCKCLPKKPIKEKINPYTKEIELWKHLFSESNLPIEIAKLLHFYILAQAQFERIQIQQIKQNGFRQFLYISENKVRDHYEDDGFKERFLQLNKNIKNKIINLEIRVTPKNFCKKMEKIVNTYTKLIDDSLIDKDRFKISIICHFIKFEEPSPEGWISVQRFAHSKAKALEETKSLLGCITPLLDAPLESKKKYDLFVGLDAAGNELYSRPEAFSHSFSLIRKTLKNKDKKIGITFHAGEDFIHILSGIRYVYEVYTFLEYQSGDRIGHANALGLNPKIWREKLNNNITIKKGEWLDNLILLVVKTKCTDRDILDDIVQYWQDIYSNNFTIEEILDIGFEAYQLRQYLYDAEIEKIAKHPQKDIILDIYKKYLFHTYDTYDEDLEIQLDEKFDSYITGFQDVILLELAQKEIIIESMISSNVRISFYDRYKEHHIVKWLDKQHNMPLVTLASDDPGIFNTNIFCEYSHLYDMLDQNNDKFNKYNKILTDNGKKASFANRYLHK